jgi:hypothetical protein
MYPQGKVAADDEGALTVAVTVDHQQQVVTHRLWQGGALVGDG